MIGGEICTSNQRLFKLKSLLLLINISCRMGPRTIAIRNQDVGIGLADQLITRTQANMYQNSLGICWLSSYKSKCSVDKIIDKKGQFLLKKLKFSLILLD